jgi:LysM repeat protein
VAAVLAALALAGLGDATYTVVKGESLWKIAKKFGTTPQAIAEANHIANPALVFIGQQLRVPGAGQPAPAPAVAPARAVPGTPSKITVSYTVAGGDNLARIANKLGSSVGEIVAANKIRDPNLIRVGQVLNVPVPAPPVPPAPPPPPAVEQLLDRYSKEFGVNPALVKAIAWQESGWQQQVVSDKGAVGVMQMLPSTGKFAGQYLLRADVDVTNVEHNVKAGVRFLAFLIKNAGGDEAAAVAGYYQGAQSVKVKGVLPDTQHYVANVMALKKRFGG